MPVTTYGGLPLWCLYLTVVNYTGGEVVCSHGHVDFTVNILFVGGGS